MCLCLRVFWTVLQNLIVRMVNDATDIYYSGCCNKNHSEISEVPINQNIEEYITISSEITSHPESPVRHITEETYFRAVDRETAEEILLNRVDGSCLVRPYKEIGTCIKYIASVYAQNNYFHLYIREINGIKKYGIGIEKPLEKLFDTPNDIISYYRLNKLLCTNKNISISLVLVPI